MYELSRGDGHEALIGKLWRIRSKFENCSYWKHTKNLISQVKISILLVGFTTYPALTDDPKPKILTM